ncbi:MAG: hypothetical protein HY821_03795 [Acidobacteria bacterium]|nr:hypothetical protein [Acidobacteriota bacterium]
MMYSGAVRTMVLACLCAGACLAGTEPKKSAGEYPAHATVSQGDMGAEFFSRAYESVDGGFFSRDYLVVEVALFPFKGPRSLTLRPGDFRLRLNGSTREWSTATAGQVAAAIKNPELDGPRPNVVAGGGMGPGAVVIGQPRPVERFPGDPQGRVPSRPSTTGEKAGPTDLEKGSEAVAKYALDTVQVDQSGASGLVFFYWRGKVKDLKRIELVYDGEAGKTVIRLR